MITDRCYYNFNIHHNGSKLLKYKTAKSETSVNWLCTHVVQGRTIQKYSNVCLFVYDKTQSVHYHNNVCGK